MWFSPLNLIEPVDLGVLDRDEQERAGDLKGDEVRNRWLAGRVHLRQILARYLDGEARELSIVYQPDGRPELEGGGDLVFSRSTSGATAVVAVARGGRLGIDIEAVKAVERTDGLSSWVFTPNEAAWVEKGPGSEWQSRFLRLWTAKEAMVKAHGEGMRLGFSTFEVEPSALSVQLPPKGTSRTEWHLAAVSGAPGIVGTVARLGPAPASRVRLLH